MATFNFLRWQPPPIRHLWRLTLPTRRGYPEFVFSSKWPQRMYFRLSRWLRSLSFWFWGDREKIYPLGRMRVTLCQHSNISWDSFWNCTMWCLHVRFSSIITPKNFVELTLFKDTPSSLILKGHGPIFKNFVLWFILRTITPKMQIQNFSRRVNLFRCTKQFCILQLPVFYCVSLIMITITRHVFINIFQTEHFSGVKFDMGYEEKYELPCDTKIAKSLKKLNRKDRTELL